MDGQPFPEQQPNKPLGICHSALWGLLFLLWIAALKTVMTRSVFFGVFFQQILSLDDEEEILNILMLRQDDITSNSEAVDMFMSLDVEVGQLAPNDAEELNTARENHSQREKQTKQFTDAWVAKKKVVTTKQSLLHEKSNITTHKT